MIVEPLSTHSQAAIPINDRYWVLAWHAASKINKPMPSTRVSLLSARMSHLTRVVGPQDFQNYRGFEGCSVRLFFR